MNAIGINAGDKQAHATALPLASLVRRSAVTTYTAGTEIYVPGALADNFYEVEYGAVRLHRLLTDGRRQVVAFYLAGETFGFEADRRHTLFAEAIVATGVRTISPGTGEMSAHHVLKLALQAVQRAQEHLTVVGRQTAVERIAGFLVDMAERQGNLEHFDLPMSRLDIADYLGITIETVSRVFAKLRNSRLITLKTVRSVKINNMEALASLCA